MNLPYLILRIIRHFLPEKLVRILLLRSWVIHPGLETSNPSDAVRRYTAILSGQGMSFQNKRVLVFGYGGRFDIGFELLNAGASHVTLCDKYASPDDVHNKQLFFDEKKYFTMVGNELRPRTEWIELVQADILDETVRSALEPKDIIVSSSVYEHLDDVEGITSALATLTKPDGVHIHFVDLRDHFFKYPFEMLRFSDWVWRNILNPSSNHNRYRLWEYRRVFEDLFDKVEIKILSRDNDAFRRAQRFILPKFLSENTEENDVTTICIIATTPIKE